MLLISFQKGPLSIEWRHTRMLFNLYSTSPMCRKLHLIQMQGLYQGELPRIQKMPFSQVQRLAQRTPNTIMSVIQLTDHDPTSSQGEVSGEFETGQVPLCHRHFLVIRRRMIIHREGLHPILLGRPYYVPRSMRTGPYRRHQEFSDCNSVNSPDQ